MHPAPSLIAFTVLSGLGFGVLTWLGLGVVAPAGWGLVLLLCFGFGLTVAGLLSSTLHLGHPERAWRAFSQWQSSWLSREAVLAVAALAVMGIYAALWLFFGLRVAWLGQFGAVICMATVFATSMIYAQLRTVPRWHNWTTPLVFLSLSLTGGALVIGYLPGAAPGLLISSLAILLHWALGDGAFAKRAHSVGTATGLGPRGAVRQFEPPHTGSNYLLHEMVYKVGRKHAMKLRSTALALTVLIPILAVLMLPIGWVTLGLAAVSHVIGALAVRWLFFAQAEHVVGLYYDAHAR